MQTVLKDLPGVQNNLDDIVVWGSSKAEHDECLRTVLQRLVNVGLRLNFEKSTFNQPSIRYLGHIISKDGLCPNPDHIKAISEAPAPADLQALQDPRLPTLVSTDASDYGLGGVLSQLHPDNTERIVAFASRTLSDAERKYSTVEKEALACMWAVDRSRTYLWGHR